MSDGRTTFNASVLYSCAENYTLVGEARRVCSASGSWQPDQPQCLCKLQFYSIINCYSFIDSFIFLRADGRCPTLPQFDRGAVSLSGLNANDTATYTCDLGHKLVGSKVLTCRLGGTWSSSPPTCQFVDCGPPQEPEHGSVWLLNSTTTFASQASHKCDEDYRLVGRLIRLCQEDGSWSSSLPTCKCNFILIRLKIN